MGGDAAEGIACLDAFLYHALADELDGSKGCASGSGLDGESVLEVAAVYDCLCGKPCEKYVTRVL